MHRVVLTSIGIVCLQQRVDRTTDPVDSSADGEEAVRTAGGNDESVTILYTTLQKLAFNHAVQLGFRTAQCHSLGATPRALGVTTARAPKPDSVLHAGRDVVQGCGAAAFVLEQGQCNQCLVCF